MSQTREERSRRLRADAILLIRYGVLFWTVILLVLLVSLLDVVRFSRSKIAGAVLTYAGVLAAVGIAVGTGWILIWACSLAVARLRGLAARRSAVELGGRNDLWDEWLDVPGAYGDHSGSPDALDHVER